MNPNEKQIGGDHYKKMEIEPIEYIEKNKLGFSEGAIIKYITRHKDKGGAEDIRKIIHFCEFILKYQYNEEDKWNFTTLINLLPDDFRAFLIRENALTEYVSRGVKEFSRRGFPVEMLQRVYTSPDPYELRNWFGFFEWDRINVAQKWANEEALRLQQDDQTGRIKNDRTDRDGIGDASNQDNG